MEESERYRERCNVEKHLERVVQALERTGKIESNVSFELVVVKTLSYNKYYNGQKHGAQ